MLPTAVLPTRDTDGQRRTRAVGMIHVHCTTAILNHNCTKVNDIVIPSVTDTLRFCEIIKEAEQLLGAVLTAFPVLEFATRTHPCRSLIFLIPHFTAQAAEVQLVRRRFDALIENVRSMVWIQSLELRAIAEAGIMWRNGIDIVEVENVGAPYFVGSDTVPWEELFAIYACTKAVDAARREYRTRGDGRPPALGVHILSCDELESLPIALATGCFFVRSEATLFAGQVRPEGAVKNDGNLARFLYLRRVLRQLCSGGDGSEAAQLAQQRQMHLPLVFSDLHKKHTHFVGDLDQMTPWLENLGFCHLEGAIITGNHTGSDVDIPTLAAARVAIDKYIQFLRAKVIPASASCKSMDGMLSSPEIPFLPLVTGSGNKLEEYVKAGADFIIVGSALKRGGYWENHVCEDAVKAVVVRIQGAHAPVPAFAAACA